MYQPVYTHWELEEIESCYFAALIDGLRLINEHSKARPDLEVDLSSDALVHYVQRKGRMIYRASEKQVWPAQKPELTPNKQVLPAQKLELNANKPPEIGEKLELNSNEPAETEQKEEHQKEHELEAKLFICGNSSNYPKFYRIENVRKACTMLMSGNGVRETARALKMHTLTVTKIKRWLGKLIGACPCGRPNGHKGWCGHRIAKSPRRQRFLRHWHRKKDGRHKHRGYHGRFDKERRDQGVWPRAAA